MIPRKGDRIVVIGLMQDPVPIEIGTTGTVTDRTNVGTQFEQVYVDWDRSPSGEKRTLMLTPRDYRIIRRLTPEEERERDEEARR